MNDLRKFMDAVDDGYTVVVHPITYQKLLESGVRFEKVAESEYIPQDRLYALDICKLSIYEPPRSFFNWERAM